MKSRIICSTFAAALLAGIAVAQDLDTVSITDQFTTGARGNETGTGGGFGASNTTGTEFLDYSGADATGTPIRYINTYAGASGAGDAGGESPVLAVTGVGNPDRSLIANTIPANTRPGATSASNVIQVSDDGGINCLYFGEPNDADYFVEVDIYCYDASAITPSATIGQIAGIAARAGRDDEDNATINGGAYAIDREPSFALVYDYHGRDVYAIQTRGTGTSGDALNVAGGAGVFYAVLYGTSLDIAEGWHTFRIEADGATVNFLVDGVQIGTTSTDGATVTNGRPALSYREGGVVSASERAGTFDNLKAGPFSLPASVSEWTAFE